ncbi:uncharacterized protein LOC143199365 [Rhynchophorus ferrugineus]|uniref:uncharacterized protein LOC143199365 n=1 Tax=Rhynchophorus ferrugineus TaxID=354439 RepID=UPI003FCEB0C4
MKLRPQLNTCFWIVALWAIADCLPWPQSYLDLTEDLHDAEVYRAVMKSMNDWQKRRDLRRSTNRTKREEPSVCYPELGCFEASGPFGYLDMLPNKPEEINTKFLMYPARTRRRRSGSAPAEIPFDKLTEAFEWAKSGFNKSLPTKVLIHGFGSDCGYIWAYEIRSALMAVEEVNTICVDWSNGASLPNYVKASANTRLVGKQLSLLLRGLVDKNGLSLRDTHLIGFSLGAHIAGFAGADLGNLSRITGLDPAGPLFESQDTRARLDQTDAAFVDVIHSNGENLILGGLGSSQPMGHVDFYPNGGRMQKGCSHLFVGAVSDIIWSSAVEGRSLCNHRRAYKFFIDSVSPRCHFPAFPCDSYDDFIAGKCFPCSDERKCGNMGYYADRSKGRGQLYLITRDEEPFCAHQYLVKIESTPGPVPVKSYGKIQITLIGDSFLNETFMMTRKEDEEMKLGGSISRILVPHPILSQPTRIEILYTAYSGWLSSGLAQWKVDRVTLMDSFGKMSSVCKKSLKLESGVPVVLPLHPGECDPEKDSPKEADDRMQDQSYDSDKEIDVGFVPTQVIKVGIKETEDDDASLSDKDIFSNSPLWKPEEESNFLDNEAESSRAFNTRLAHSDKLNKNQDGVEREVVEPILKAQSTKNARSHDPEKAKPEITEPILGPTTSKITDTDMGEMAKNVTNSVRKPDYDVAISEMDKKQQNRREGESKSLKDYQPDVRPGGEPSGNPLDTIVTTVQLLPQRLARMFEQAEKYARENILPLVSTYTPRFISDFIGPKPAPVYIPLSYEETEVQEPAQSRKVVVGQVPGEARTLHLPTLQPIIPVFSTTEEYSHIQRISKKKQEATIARKESTTQSPETSSVQSSSITSTSKLTNTYTFNRANSSFSIEIDSPSPKTKRQDASRSPKVAERVKQQQRKQGQEISTQSDENFRPLDNFVSAIQYLPEGFAKILTQAQDYTRRNILPIVESYTPRKWTDLIWIRQKPNVTMNVQRESNNDTGLQEDSVHVNLFIGSSGPDSQDSTTSTEATLSKFSSTTTRKTEINENTIIQSTTSGSTQSSVTIQPKIILQNPSNVPDSTTQSNRLPFSSTTAPTPSAKPRFPLLRLLSGRAPIFIQNARSKQTTPSTLSRWNKNIFRPVDTNPSTVQSGTTQSPKTNTRKSIWASLLPNDPFSFKSNVSVVKYIVGKTATKTNQSQRNVVQRIPKRGEKTNKTLSVPLTVLIDPKDLTTTTTSTTTTTTSTTKKPSSKKPFQSYVQKIPKKTSTSKSSPFKAVTVHPLIRNTKNVDVKMTAKDAYGGDVWYRLTSDGRFEA